MLPALAAGVVLVGVAGCGGRDDEAPATPPASVTADAGAGGQVDDVGGAVEDAERLLADIDAELAADDATTD